MDENPRYEAVEAEVAALSLEEVIDVIMAEIEQSLAHVPEQERKTCLHEDRSTLTNNAERDEEGLRLTATQLLYRKRMLN